jgi:serine/threonine-protein phosphatase 2B catalytic subunit
VQAPAMTIPTDDQFFSKTDKGKPDVAFLKNHFYREGRLKEEHALYIIEKATQLLRAEPNVLSVDSPVTGATIECSSASSSNLILFSSLR